MRAARAREIDCHDQKIFGKDRGPWWRARTETFDEAVKENMETFEMGAEEALAEAMEAFKLQGVDLSNVQTMLPEEGGRQELRAVTATKARECGGDGWGV